MQRATRKKSTYVPGTVSKRVKIAKAVEKVDDERVIAKVKRSISRKNETKYIDYLPVNQSATAIVTNFYDITTITAGIAGNERVGQQIEPKRLEMSMTLFTGATPTDSVVRLLMFTWRQDSSVAPTMGALLSNGPSGIPDVNSHWNYNNRLSYHVLVDRKYVINGSTNSGNNLKQVKLSFYKKLPSVVTYTLGQPTGENHIYVVVMSDLGGTAAPRVTFDSRIYFKDS